MEIIKIVGVGVITAIVALIVKPLKPEIALLISIAGGMVIFLMLINLIGSVFSSIGEIIEKAGVENELFLILLKIIGIGYITEFAANICVDSGNSSIADKIQLGGKVTILIISLPIFKNIFDIIVGLVQ